MSVDTGLYDKNDNEVYQFKDNSVSLKQNEDGFIDKTYSNNKYFMNTNNEGYKFSKMKIRTNRIPTIGDKLCLKETSYVLTNIGWIQLKDIDITKHYVATLENNENLNYVKPTKKYEYDLGAEAELSQEFESNHTEEDKN